MLDSLTVNNFAFIGRADLNFKGSLCAITGETGSGKSMLLGCLKIIFGQKPSKNLSTKGCASEPCVIAATLDVSHNEHAKEFLATESIKTDDLVVLRRVVSDGKVRSFINDIAVSAALYEKFAGSLCEMHGQHEQTSLRSKAEHIKLLDEYAQINLAEYKREYEKLQQLQKELLDMRSFAERNARQEGFLEFLVKELQDASIESGEEVKLENAKVAALEIEKNRSKFDDIAQFLHNKQLAYDALQCALKLKTDGASDEVNEKVRHLQAFLQKIYEGFVECEQLLQGVMLDLSSVQIDIDDVQGRLFFLKDLMRKHKVRSTEDLLELFKTSVEDLDKIKNVSHNSEQILQEIKLQFKVCKGIAEKISLKRKSAALEVEGKILQELKDLGMPFVRCKIAVNDKARDVEQKALEQDSDAGSSKNSKCFGPSGCDDVEFLLSVNPGTPFTNIASTASGGEMSRVMLALKKIFSQKKGGGKGGGIIIFDEIDTGLGGVAASAVAQKLVECAKSSQIIIVSHQAQIAAIADMHVLVEKKQHKNDLTVTTARILTKEERVWEVARMLCGNEKDEEAIILAKKMLL